MTSPTHQHGLDWEWLLEIYALVLCTPLLSCVQRAEGTLKGACYSSYLCDIQPVQDALFIVAEQVAELVAPTGQLLGVGDVDGPVGVQRSACSRP